MTLFSPINVKVVKIKNIANQPYLRNPELDPLALLIPEMLVLVQNASNVFHNTFKILTSFGFLLTSGIGVLLRLLFSLQRLKRCVLVSFKMKSDNLNTLEGKKDNIKHLQLVSFCVF